MIIMLCISMSGADSKVSRKAKIPAGSTPWDSGELRGRSQTPMLASLEDLDTDNGYPVCLSSKSAQISDVTSENRTVWLGQRDDQRINCRTLPRATPQLGRSTSEGQRHRIFDQTSTDELVEYGIATGAGLQGLDQNHGRNHRRPQVPSTQ